MFPSNFFITNVIRNKGRLCLFVLVFFCVGGYIFSKTFFSIKAITLSELLQSKFMVSSKSRVFFLHSDRQSFAKVCVYVRALPCIIFSEVSQFSCQTLCFDLAKADLHNPLPPTSKRATHLKIRLNSAGRCLIRATGPILLLLQQVHEFLLTSTGFSTPNRDESLREPIHRPV